MTTTTTTTTTTSTPVVRTGVYPHVPIAVIASFGQFVTRSRSCAASLSHLANDRPMHYRFSFWPWELTPGPNFTKLGGGLQQTPLPHPAKFQPDRANALRDVRYQCVHPLTSWGGLTPGSKSIKRGDDPLSTKIYHPAKFHRPESTHAGDIPYKISCRHSHISPACLSVRYVGITTRA